MRSQKKSCYQALNSYPAELERRIRALLRTIPSEGPPPEEGSGEAPAAAVEDSAAKAAPAATGSAAVRKAAPTPAAEDVDAAGEHDARLMAEELYERAVRYAKRQVRLIRQEGRVEIEQAHGLADEIVAGLARGNHLLLKAMAHEQSYDLGRHLVNVMIFAVKVGYGLNYTRNELVRLALVGLMHDVGMALVPPDLVNKEGSLAPEEFDTIKQHPERSRELIAGLGPDYHWLANIVCQEHERENGQGYPQGLHGDDINEFAKVVGVADIYEAFSHPRTFRKTFIAYEALQKVIDMRGEFFPPKIIRALMNEISIFPLGSYVQLNTGEIGRVIATDVDQLLRPALMLLYDHEGTRKRQPTRVDLKESPLLYIAKPIYDEELPA